jgi:hypothetical protein
MLKQLQEVKMELRRRMHDPIAKTGAWLNRMLKGQLHIVTDQRPFRQMHPNRGL